MKITLDQFYQALKNCVRYYPENEQPCLRLNGFKAIQKNGAAEIELENMGATPCEKDKPYFYSRTWEQAAYNPNKLIGQLPVLSAFEVGATIDGSATGQVNIIHEFVLSVWDKYDEGKCGSNCDSCEARTINEIYRDTQTMLISTLQYLGGIVLATTNANPTPAVYHTGMLQKMVTDAEITTFQIVQKLENTMNAAGQKLQIFRQEMISANLYGTAVKITLKAADCTAQTFTFADLDYGLLAQEAGCKNC